MQVEAHLRSDPAPLRLLLKLVTPPPLPFPPSFDRSRSPRGEWENGPFDANCTLDNATLPPGPPWACRPQACLLLKEVKHHWVQHLALRVQAVFLQLGALGEVCFGELVEIAR